MAEHSYFFNSTPGDERWYLAQDFANYFADVLSSGILPPTEGEDVGFDYQLPVHRPMSMRILGGKALIKGHRYVNEVLIGVGHELTFEPHTALWSTHRIDRVVLRLDHRNSARNIRLAIKQGTTEPPSLQRDHEVYELSLYQVRINAGVSAIDHQDITDERADEAVCGFANSLITVPTSVFQQQFDTWFENYQTSAAEDFNEWFANLGEILNENAAGNLLREIQAVDDKKADKTEVNARLYQIEQQMQQRVTYTYFDAYMASVVDWSPQGVFTTFAALEAQYPNGADGFMLVQENGHAYKWISGAWEDVGMYQSGAGDFVNALTEDGQEWVV